MDSRPSPAPITTAGRPWFRLASQIQREQPQLAAAAAPPPPPRPVFTRLPSLFAPVVIPSDPPGSASVPAQRDAPRTEAISPPREKTSETRPPPSPRPEYATAAVPPPASPPKQAPPRVERAAEVVKPPRLTPQPSPRASRGGVTEFQRPVMDVMSPPPPSPPPRPEAQLRRDFIQEFRNDTPPEQKRSPLPSPPPTVTPSSPPSQKISREPQPRLPPIRTKTVLPMDGDIGKGERKGFYSLSAPLPPTEAAAKVTKPLEPARKKKIAGEDVEVKAETGAMGMLTIAGENTGAYMDLGGSRQGATIGNGGRTKQHEPFTGRFYYAAPNNQNCDESKAEENNETGEKAPAKSSARPTTAVVNSNVQGVNNSILLRSTCTTGSPGVYVTLSSSKGVRRNGVTAPPPKPVPSGKGNGHYQ